MDSVPGLLFACVGIELGVTVVVCGGRWIVSLELMGPALFAAARVDLCAGCSLVSILFSRELAFIPWSSEATVPQDDKGCAPLTFLAPSWFLSYL